MIYNETILITGGAGFIGAHLAERLAAHNKVRVFDTFGRQSVSGFRLAEHPNVECIVGDVCDAAAVAAAVDGCDRVAHLASIAGVSTVLNNPSLTMRVVIQGTTNVMEACVGRDEIKRVVTFSTSEVYGRFAFNVSENDATPIGPVGESRWTYAVSKIATEHLAHGYFREFDIPTTSIRPFNIYGPGQIGEGAIHNFMKHALEGDAIWVNNDGRQIRSWCYVDDIVDGTIKALEEQAAVGEAFNIGNPMASLNVYRLAELVRGTVGSSCEIKFRRRDYPDVETRVPNIDKARELLGFDPVVALEDGLERTVKWYREQLP